MAKKRGTTTAKMDIKNSPMAKERGTTTAKMDIKNSPMAKKRGTKRATTAKRDIKEKRKAIKFVKYEEDSAFDMFMITDFLVRYYKTRPRPSLKSVAVPDDLEIAIFEAEEAGCKEWVNMSDDKKAEWMDKYEKVQAEGKSLMSLRKEYSSLY